MCSCVQENICSITKERCPWTYYCTKKQVWQPSKNMPNNCKIKLSAETPEGYCRVVQERNGILYVSIQGQTYKIPNPFDDVPLFVKARKLKSGKWALKK